MSVPQADPTPPALPGVPLLGLRTPHARPKGMAAWNRRHGGVYDRLVADVLAVMDEYGIDEERPAGPRSIGYRLLARWVGEGKRYADKASLNNAISEVTGKGRRAGLIPFGAISDGRSLSDRPWLTSDLPMVTEEAQVDRQAEQPFYIEVWIEAREYVARSAAICKPFGITVRSGSGSIPLTQVQRAAVRVVNRYIDHRQPSLFLVVVDFDPEGIKNVAQALDADLHAFIRDFGGDPDWLTVRHVALTAEQAAALPPVFRENLSPRHRNTTPDWPVDYKAQVEALPFDQYDALIEQAILAVHDPDALNTAMAAEPEARIETLQGLLDELEGER